MRITVNVRIDQEASDGPNYGSHGSLSFSEDASLPNANFGTISEVFTRVHLLLDTLRIEHKKR